MDAFLKEIHLKYYFSWASCINMVQGKKKQRKPPKKVNKEKEVTRPQSHRNEKRRETDGERDSLKAHGKSDEKV